MKFIAHRGNIDGPSKENENRPQHIKGALAMGFHVEVDVWITEGGHFMLGHDEPQYEVEYDFLVDQRILCHPKNVWAIEHFACNKEEIHWFCHDKDDYALTSKGLVVTYPGKIVPVLPRHSIVMMPEMQAPDSQVMDHIKLVVQSTHRCYAVCSDYARFCKEVKEGLHD